MTRSPAAYRSLPAFVAWLVALLQVIGALHFALIPHTFSAALGGVAHLHAERRSSEWSHRRAHERTAALVNDAASCSADSCPVADAPAGSILPRAAAATGCVSFGGVRLLSPSAAESAVNRRIFLSAPKTSPPS
ncbi:MAG: hypothetical protein ABJB12_03730 [Pseudomonadota bacterium]